MFHTVEFLSSGVFLRRARILDVIKRTCTDVNNMKRSYVICSRHLHSGKPAGPMDETNVDWAPTLHLGHEKRQQSSQRS